MQRFLKTLAALATLALTPQIAQASFYDINRHNGFITNTTALDFQFGGSFFDAGLNSVSGTLLGTDLSQLSMRCFESALGVNTPNEFGPTCADGSAGQIEGGTRLFYTLGTSRGASDLGEFGIINPGGSGQFYTGASYAIADRNNFSQQVSFTNADVFLRIWSLGDDFAPTHVYFSLFDTVNSRTLLADSTFLGTAAIAPVPLPATGLLLIAGLGGFTALRRKRN